MDIDRNSPLPKHFQLGEAIKNDIIKKGLTEGDLIPSERTLSETFDVSRFTVRRAVSDLVRDGILRREGRRGAFVNRIPTVSSWQPNAVRRLLGVIIPDIEDFFAARLVNGMDSLSHQMGYSIALGRSDEHFERTSQQIARLLTEQVAGIIMVPIAGKGYEEMNLRLFSQVRSAGVPLALIDRYVEGSDADTVVSDNFDGAYKSTQHLISLGHKQIAYIGYPECSTVHDRVAGYKKCLMDNGVHPACKLILRNHPRRDRERTRQVTRDFVLMNPRVTAIVTANDGVAMDVWNELQEMGVRVPEDVALVGYDNASGYTGPGAILTTVEQPLFDEGRLACRNLLDRIEGYDGEPRFECLQSTFVLGRSTVHANTPAIRSETPMMSV